MSQLRQIVRWALAASPELRAATLQPAQQLLKRSFSSKANSDGKIDLPPSDTPPAQDGGEQPPQAAQQPGPAKPTEWYRRTPVAVNSNSDEPLKSSEYASSHDDVFGVQRNWFTSLYKQLNYFAKTGAVPGLKGRQKQVFEAVEKEFESLYAVHIKASGLTGMEHRAMLMVCLSIATTRILSNEVPDPALVRDVIRTNQGSLMMGLLLPLHRLRIWVLRYLMAEEPFKQAVRFLPALQSDMGGLCEGEVQLGPAQGQAQESSGAETLTPQAAGLPGGSGGADEVSLVIKRCRYHEVLSKEDAPYLLSEFCCNHGMVFLKEFSRHGVDVSLDRCMAWEDDCCSIRLARRKQG